MFFGGNHSRIDITTPVDENKNLLIFKDSYANCFIPFLQPYFRSIIVIDPRYYYDDVDRLVTDNSITDVLFLYNVDTFMTDTSLADGLEPMPESQTDSTAENDTSQEGQAEGTAEDGTSQTEQSDSSQDGQSSSGTEDDSASDSQAAEAASGGT